MDSRVAHQTIYPYGSPRTSTPTVYTDFCIKSHVYIRREQAARPTGTNIVGIHVLHQIWCLRCGRNIVVTSKFVGEIHESPEKNIGFDAFGGSKPPAFAGTNIVEIFSLHLWGRWHGEL